MFLMHPDVPNKSYITHLHRTLILQNIDTYQRAWIQTVMFCPVSEVLYPIKYFEIEERTGDGCLKPP